MAVELGKVPEGNLLPIQSNTQVEEVAANWATAVDPVGKGVITPLTIDPDELR